MKVPQLSPEAVAAIKGELPLKPMASAADPENRKEWLLARTRSTSLGIRLVLAEIDEIGISLKNGWISPEEAARCLAALEQVPVYVAAIFYRGSDE
jgi:hypothetical protein